MNFLSPEALAFAAALPVVIVFYLLKRKRVVKLISSTLLWQKFLAETQANAPFQRLRHNWLLVLQLLLLALVVFALTRPFLTGNSKNSRLRVSFSTRRPRCKAPMKNRPASRRRAPRR